MNLNQYMIEQSDKFQTLHDQLDKKLDIVIATLEVINQRLEEIEFRVNPNRE